MRHRAISVIVLVLSLACIAAADDWKGDFKGPLGVQTWSLREQLKVDSAAAFKAMKDAGYTEVELAWNAEQLKAYKTPADLKTALDQVGLKVTSMHVGYTDFQADMPGVIARAKALGASYVGAAWIPHKGTFRVEDAQRAAADFNKWGKQLKEAGLSLFYHTHGYEFVDDGGQVPLDVLISSTDASVMNFQMDVFWVYWPGQDPVKWLKKYPGRFVSLHIKDMRKDAKPGVDQTGKAPKEYDMPAGSGQIPYAAILKAAAETGVKRYYIEDESPDAPGHIVQAMQWLRQLKW